MKREHNKSGQTISEYLRSKGYQTCEYIQSSGTQYINTGLYPDGETLYKCRFKIPYSTNPGVGIMGVDYMNSSYTTYLCSGFEAWPYADNPLEFIFSYDKRTYGCPLQFDTIFTATLNGNLAYLDDVLEYELDKFTTTSYRYPIYIFKVNMPGSGRRVVPGSNEKLVIYYAQINEHKYYPVYNTSTGVIGLYDILSDSFFGNAGTGSFTKGVDVEIEELYNEQ